MINKTCLHCGKSFSVRNYRRNTAKFCSYSCSGKYRYSNSVSIRESFKHDYSGDKHPSWNGGRQVNSQGYILIYSPNHPYKDNRNCVREHRIVMEKYLKRYLLPGEVVHHKNGDKHDNRLENLELFTKKEHDSLHSKQHAEIIKLRRIQKICVYCGKHFDVPRSLERLKCCSLSCATHYKWDTLGLKAFGRHER